jgi:hypothetical protein
MIWRKLERQETDCPEGRQQQRNQDRDDADDHQ